MTELSCFASLAGSSGLTSITQLGVSTGWWETRDIQQGSRRGCSEAGTNVLSLAVGLGCPAAGKGRGAMEEGVQNCHLQCMNKQLWMRQPNCLRRWALPWTGTGLSPSAHMQLAWRDGQELQEEWESTQ